MITGEYWLKDVVQLERSTLASGGGPPIADAYTINGHPGPNYNCSANGILYSSPIHHTIYKYCLNSVLIV